jgi:hypothetical protein
MSYLSKITKYMRHISNQKIFAGIMMIILNIGSKYISLNLSPSQEAFLKNSVARQILIFAVAFIGTKDLITSLALTAVFTIITGFLFHEDSKFCLVPTYMQQLKSTIDTNNDGQISKDEIKAALDILNKFSK